MNYNEALEYIHSINWTFCKPGLERIKKLCAAVGDPQKKLKFIHVAGTNGKGSFCSMMDSVLRKNGYKVGLYTSPYIKVFNERMRVNGENISDDVLAELTEYIRPIADSMEDKPTEFELITAIAFLYFEREGCDFVVLEAGMGGRLDSTNIIDTSVLSVITGISLDHVAFLGDTTEKIAAEKAGIIKSGVPVLWGGTDEGACQVISNTAKERGSEFFKPDYQAITDLKADLRGTSFKYKNRSVKINLLGLYQPRNASLVLEALDILLKCGVELDEEKTVYDEVAGGVDVIPLGTEHISVRAYLKRFLFEDERINGKVKYLSGGEKARLLLAKVLKRGGNFLILDEPTRGIDVGAKYEIYCIIADLAKEGKSIIMISSEMSELIGMSDRIMVMCDGRVTGFVDGSEATQENIMALATQFE